MTPADPGPRRTPGEGEEPVRRPDASMTLITSMLERPLDPGYAAVADGREQAGLPRSTGTRTRLVVVAAVVIGLLLGIAAASLRASASGLNAAKGELVSQIESQQAAADASAARIRAIQDDISSLQATSGSASQAAEVDRLRLLAASQAVTGPGMTVTLNDAPAQNPGSADANPRTTAGGDGRVLARDLQIVVNSLWESGAEAVAVNGHRLNARSAIRFAGDAILVNFRPLTRPYTIEAIGDPKQLQTRFAEGIGGSYLSSLRDNYGIQTDMRSVDVLTLPSAVTGSLRSATVVGDGAATGPSTPPGGRTP